VQYSRALTRTATPWLLPLAAVALTIAIFLIDVVSPLGMAVAALYAIVVMMATNFCDRRGLLLVSAICAGLTIFAFAITHGMDFESTAFVRGLVSLSAIAIAAILALKNKAAEVALRRSEAYLTEAQRLSHTGSFGWRVAREEIVWSEETYRILEYDPSLRPTLALVFERTHPDDLAAVKEVAARAALDGRHWSIEHRLLMPDGSIKFVNVVAHGGRDASGNIEFVGAIMDETASKRAEEDLQQARSNLAHVNRVTTLGEMTASISHEVSQPIAAVVTNAGAGLRWLSAQPSNTEEVKRALSRILKDGNRASEVITRIRALSKKMPPRKDLLAINDIVLEVVGLTRGEAERSRVSVQTALARGLPPVSGDRIQLQQVVLNLMVNAMDAMHGNREGSRELLVGSQMGGSDSVVVIVKDSGPGIDPDHIGRIFEAFYTTKPHGIGMGLAICRSIVEAHDGRLWAATNGSRGATFQFSLPVDANGR
jgi:two-component system sensor kinase FixL